MDRWRWVAVPAMACLLYGYGLTRAGLLGPDEPRYAAIGREMARSGDWITPRLWGEPWFEKPALIFWMTGLAFRLGAGPDLAPRLPVVVCSILFLGLYWWALRNQWGERAAWHSTVILATSALWLAYSRAGATDLPMSAAFSAAMLFSLDWLRTGERRRLPWVAALLGVAVLAKGLVPLVLALPLAWAGRKRLIDLLRPANGIAFLLVAAPWYVLCYLRNGHAFIEKFFWEHHFGRFSSTALQHVQPFWFYVPVLMLALFPWTPMVTIAFGRKAFSDPARRFLLLWLAFGLVFFSASVNKLPGYVLPLIPPLAALCGIALAERKDARVPLACAAALLVAVAPLAHVLPEAIALGLRRATWPHFEWFWLLPLGAVILAWRLRREAAMIFLSCAVAAAYLYVEIRALPAVDKAASVRPFWESISSRRAEICVETMHRSWRYGLNYYSETPLPECGVEPRPLHIRQEGSRPPVLATP